MGRTALRGAAATKVVDGRIMIGFFVSGSEEQLKFFALHQLIGGSDEFFHRIDM